MNSNEIIPIFFACDNSFIPYTIVAIKSMIDNASKEYQYNIHILNVDISDEMKETASRLSDDHFTIDFVNVKEYLKSVESKLPVRDYYSNTTYFRLFIADMFPQYDKAIYIDSDIVVLGDISEMYNHELGEYLTGAVRDQVIIQDDTFGDYIEKVLGMSRNLYFNAGVMLINCRKFREQKVFDKFIKLLHTYTFVVAQDQDYLNLICNGKVLWMEPKWDAEVFGTLPCEEKDICILHYNMAAKPWHYENCRMSEYFWKYAKMTECYDIIRASMEQYTEEQRKQDQLTGEHLLEMAISEINNENNYLNMLKRSNGQSEDRQKILDKIALYEKEGRFDEDVEEDPESKTLMPEDIKYIRKNIRSRLRTKYAYRIARWFLNMLIKKKKLIIKEVIGIENFRNLNSGAIITCNHFNAFDSFAMQVAYDRSKHRKRKLYRVIREGNYTSFPGFYGFLMRNCNTLPLSSNFKTMEKFIEAVDKLLQKGNFVLVYPEQSMWWNYRKPKPMKKGAFTFAARNNVPVLPCFITMEDSDILDEDGFYVQEYTIHVSEPIYPDKSKSKAQNAEYLKNKNYDIWKKIYEETYHIPLEYTCDGKMIN